AKPVPRRARPESPPPPFGPPALRKIPAGSQGQLPSTHPAKSRLPTASPEPWAITQDGLARGEVASSQAFERRGQAAQNHEADIEPPYPPPGCTHGKGAQGAIHRRSLLLSEHPPWKPQQRLTARPKEPTV